MSGIPIDSSFYKAVSKLFYAFMICDKQVRKEEVDACLNHLNGVWPDERGVLSFQYYIMDLLLANETMEHCFEAFESYYKQHFFLFSPELKHLLKETAGVITSSFSSKNKSELVLLAKLQLLLK